MNLREWLIVIGIVVIIGVLASGFRSMGVARRRARELSFGLEEIKGNSEDFGSELPNGGARKRQSRSGGLAEQAEPLVSYERPQQKITTQQSQPQQLEVERVPLGCDRPESPLPEPASQNMDNLRQNNVEQAVMSSDSEPVSKQSAAVETPPAPQITDEVEGQAVAVRSVDSTRQARSPVSLLADVREQPEPSLSLQESGLPPMESSHSDLDQRSVRLTGLSVEGGEPVVSEPDMEQVVSGDESGGLSEEFGPEVKSEPIHFDRHRLKRQEKLAERPQVNEVLVINLLAKNGETLDGSRLLQGLLDAGMRFGDMSIFHRYTNIDGTGQIMFSLANGVEPGTFNIATMEEDITPAVSLFMSLPGPDEPLKAVTLMEETARQLALDLGGVLKDEHFSVLTRQTVEHYRQRVRDFERKQLTQKVAE